MEDSGWRVFETAREKLAATRYISYPISWIAGDRKGGDTLYFSDGGGKFLGALGLPRGRN